MCKNLICNSAVPVFQKENATDLLNMYCSMKSNMHFSTHIRKHVPFSEFSEKYLGKASYAV
jgi:hypothetical protein